MNTESGNDLVSIHATVPSPCELFIEDLGQVIGGANGKPPTAAGAEDGGKPPEISTLATGEEGGKPPHFTSLALGEEGGGTPTVHPL
jgi:hypothetical protein